eukprot:scaffold235539_cov43-Prasinocladus_malaysianus.AAC.1
MQCWPDDQTTSLIRSGRPKTNTLKLCRLSDRLRADTMDVRPFQAYCRHIDDQYTYYPIIQYIALTQ